MSPELNLKELTALANLRNPPAPADQQRLDERQRRRRDRKARKAQAQQKETTMPRTKPATKVEAVLRDARGNEIDTGGWPPHWADPKVKEEFVPERYREAYRVDAKADDRRAKEFMRRNPNTPVFIRISNTDTRSVQPAADGLDTYLHYCRLADAHRVVEAEAERSRNRQRDRRLTCRACGQVKTSTKPRSFDVLTLPPGEALTLCNGCAVAFTDAVGEKITTDPAPARELLDALLSSGANLKA